jgi:hypothetical protein
MTSAAVLWGAHAPRLSSSWSRKCLDLWRRPHAAPPRFRRAPLRTAAGKLANWEIARRGADDLVRAGSRFPFYNSFELSRDHTVDAETVIGLIGQFMTEDRVTRIADACANRTFNVLPIVVSEPRGCCRGAVGVQQRSLVGAPGGAWGV